MTKPTIDDLLARSAPPTGVGVSRVQSMLRAVAEESRVTAKSAVRHPRRRLWWLAAPLIAVPAISLATTGETEPRMVPDFTILISYTTDTGNAVTCSIDLFNGETNYAETGTAAVDYLRAQDWTGVGQSIYSAAINYENDPAWVAAYKEGWAPASSAEIQRGAWLRATDDVIVQGLPAGTLRSGDGGFGVTDHCTGELH